MIKKMRGWTGTPCFGMMWQGDPDKTNMVDNDVNTNKTNKSNIKNIAV